MKNSHLKHSFVGKSTENQFNNSYDMKNEGRKNERIWRSILANKKFLFFLLAGFIFSSMESYLHTLVKFNSNSIFSNFESDQKKQNLPRDFDFIFGKKNLGFVRDSSWSSKLFDFIFLSFFAEKFSNLLSCFFNRGLTGISKEVISSELERNQVPFDKKSEAIEKIEDEFSHEISPIFNFAVSSFQLGFDLWFFYYSILDKEYKNGRLFSHLTTSLVLFFFYYLLSKIIKHIFLIISFIRENNSHKPFFKEKGIFPEEKLSFYDIFPTFFSPFYFQTFVFWAIQKNCKKPLPFYMVGRITPALSNINNFISLRVDSFLFASYLNSFLKKAQNFFKALREVRKIYFSSRKKNKSF